MKKYLNPFTIQTNRITRLFGKTLFTMPAKQLKITSQSQEKQQSADILKHFEPSKFVPINSQTFFCKDSRGNDWNFGAPGGDFGEFLLALDCFYAFNNKEKSVEFGEIDELFGKWLNERCSKDRPFYLHSDRTAVNKLLGSKQIRDLNAEEQELFIESFPQFQGCGHLRLIIEDPKSYEIDSKLFKYLSRAFFQRYFRGDERLLFNIYECAQDGKALAVISDVSNDHKDGTSVLGIQSLSNDSDQIFILNQHAVSIYRKNYLVPFFCKNQQKTNQDSFFERMQ